MILFLGGLLLLVIGYLVYGKVIERLLGPDDRATPCQANPDGVDYVPLPKWKNCLIQLLNIAGVGPVIGVILGIKFGKIALVIIPVGCILMGAVHDFVAGMMSIRNNGANLPRLIEKYLGRVYSTLFTVVLVLMLLLVVAVFINVPAKIIDETWFPQVRVFWVSAAVIFIYYMVATIFPVDMIIGKIYPLFGALLIIGSFAILVALVVAGFKDPSMLADCVNFTNPEYGNFKASNPLFPCLFVTIACGIISGFHATQSPIVARTMRSEREARFTFFGMMILEGVIAMVWAAAALAIYNLMPETLKLQPQVVLGRIANHFLGSGLGGVTVAAVIILAITTGDTALRSCRLSFAEILHVNQVRLDRRILICIPLIVVVAILLWWSNHEAKSFGYLWNYFSWANQLISVATLMCGVSYMMREGKALKSLPVLLPGMFMTTVVVTFILWASPSKGQVWGIVPGGLDLVWSVVIGVIVSVVLSIYALWYGKCRGEV